MGSRPLTPLGLQMLASLPTRLRQSTDYQAVIHAASREIDRFEACAEQVRANMNPATADILLEAWEEETGNTIGGSGTTIAQRQQAVVTSLQEVLGAGAGLTWEERITAIVGTGWTYKEGTDNPAINLAVNPNFTHDTVSGAAAAWTDTTGIVTTGATRAVQATGGKVAAHYLKVTTTATALEGAATPLGTLPAGDYLASVYLKGNTGGEVVELVAGKSGALTTAQVTLTNAFAQYSMPFTSDGSAPWFFAVRGHAAAIVVFGISGLMVTVGDFLWDYFDGDDGGTWDGTAGDSQSTQTWPPANTISIVLPFTASGDRYNQIVTKIRQWTASHIVLEVSSSGGFILDESQLDLQELDT